MVDYAEEEIAAVEDLFPGMSCNIMRDVKLGHSLIGYQDFDFMLVW